MAGNGADRLLAALGREVGIPELELDAAGCCVLSFDEIVVNLEADGESHRLFIYADLGEAPDGLPEALYRQILEANLLWKGTGGATLSLDGQARRFVVAHGMPADRISEADFLTTIERFVDIAENWRQRIATAGAQAGAALEPLPSGSIHPGMLV
jgi:hypothetical protein